MTDNAALITEAQRLRNELINIRRLEYCIPNSPAEVLILRAVAMARKALEIRQEV